MDVAQWHFLRSRDSVRTPGAAEAHKVAQFPLPIDTPRAIDTPWGYWSSGSAPMFSTGLVPALPSLPLGLSWPAYVSPKRELALILPRGHTSTFTCPTCCSWSTSLGFLALHKIVGFLALAWPAGSLNSPALAHPGICSVTKT